MSKSPLMAHATILQARAKDVRAGGTLKLMSDAPDLIDDLSSFLVVLAARVDALTPYIDEEDDHGRIHQTA